MKVAVNCLLNSQAAIKARVVSHSRHQICESTKKIADQSMSVRDHEGNEEAHSLARSASSDTPCFISSEINPPSKEG